MADLIPLSGDQNGQMVPPFLYQNIRGRWSAQFDCLRFRGVASALVRNGKTGLMYEATFGPLCFLCTVHTNLFYFISSSCTNIGSLKVEVASVYVYNLKICFEILQDLMPCLCSVPLVT